MNKILFAMAALVAVSMAEPNPIGIGGLGLGSGIGLGGVGLGGGIGLGHGGATSSIRRVDDIYGNNQLAYVINSPLTGDIKSHTEARDVFGSGVTRTVELRPTGLVGTRTTINSPYGGTSQIITGAPFGRYVQAPNWVVIPAAAGAY